MVKSTKVLKKHLCIIYVSYICFTEVWCGRFVKAGTAGTDFRVPRQPKLDTNFPSCEETNG